MFCLPRSPGGGSGSLSGPSDSHPAGMGSRPAPVAVRGRRAGAGLAGRAGSGVRRQTDPAASPAGESPITASPAGQSSITARPAGQSTITASPAGKSTITASPAGQSPITVAAV